MAKHLKELNYTNTLYAIKKAEKMISGSRKDRENRFKNYVDFIQNGDFKLIKLFASNLPYLEYLCDLDSSENRDIELTQLKQLKEALTHHKKDIFPRFELYLQPKCTYDTENSKISIVGVEALLRFFEEGSDEKSYPLAPDSFLDLAFQAYLDNEIGFWVLEEASTILSNWKEDGKLKTSCNFAINVTPSQFKDKAYVNKFLSTVSEKRIESNLSIELIEEWSDSSDEHKLVGHHINQLHKETKVAIDDFGTGSTKIGYLADIQGLDSIKIDKTLIDAVVSKNYDKAKKLIKGIVSLAHDNNLKVVAEGVETDEQVNDILALKVDEIQGYVFYKPMSVNEFEEHHL
jgi:EAL domain-containing protein (putative c-di-GMP-specific phosphodiesterase class I)